MIDTLKVAKSFEEAGFAKAQTETLATVLSDATSVRREDLVTKDFLRGEIAVLRAELRTDIATSKTEMVRWLIGSQAVLVAILVALSNFTRTFG